MLFYSCSLVFALAIKNNAVQFAQYSTSDFYCQSVVKFRDTMYVSYCSVAVDADIEIQNVSLSFHSEQCFIGVSLCLVIGLHCVT